MKGKIVEVDWLDAQDSPHTWVDTEDAEKFNEVECKVTSIGYLIRKTDRYLTLGSDYDEADNNYGTVRKIPTKTILEIREI